MKEQIRAYIKPQVEIVELEISENIMAASLEVTEEEVRGYRAKKVFWDTDN